MGLGWRRATARDREAVSSGLQAERTAMAWQRTALGVGGVSALLLHSSHDLLQALPGVLGLALTLTLLVVAEVRYDQTVRDVVAGRSASGGRVVGGTALAVVVLSGVVLVLAVLGRAG